MEKFSLNRMRDIDVRTVSITSFRMVDGSNDQLAEVVATVTGDLSGLNLLTKMHAALDEQATPISNSFRWLDDNVGKPTRLISGFVSIAPTVRSLNDLLPEGQGSKAGGRFNLLKAGYKHVAKNMYMDENDHAWELKSGEAGEYLARTSADELPSILQAATNKFRNLTGRMVASVSDLSPAEVNTGEFAAFINSRNQVDYGFVIGASKSTGDIAIVSHAFGDKVMVHPTLIIESNMFAVPASVQANKNVGPMPGSTGGAKLKASAINSQMMIDYYKKAYVYSNSYVNALIQQIENLSAA